MPSINFYELAVTPVERVLPALVMKAYEQGLRCLVLAENPLKLEELNKAIWTFKQDAFIPHGTKEDGKPEKQPIYLSCEVENPNNSTVAFVTDGRELDAGFEKMADIFDGTLPENLSAARIRLQNYMAKGFEINHFKQNPKAGWDKI